MTTRRISLLLALAGLAAVAACDREDPTVKAVSKSANQIEMLGFGGATPGQPKSQTDTYTRIAGDMAAVNGGASQALIADSKTGLADAAIAQAHALETESLSKMNSAMSLLATWSGRNASAAASEAFDPSGDLAQITAHRAEHQANAARFKAQKEAIDKQVSDLQSQAKAKHDAADAKTTEFSRLMQSTTGMNATAAAKVAEGARAVKREADALRLAGDTLDAQAAQIAPESSALQLQIDQVTRQTAGLDADEKELNDIHAKVKEAAANARAQAAAAATQLQKQLDELAKFRAQDVATATESASKALTAAVTAGNEAAKTIPGQGKLLAADALESRAMLKWSQADGDKAYAKFLYILADVKPALPGAEGLRKSADEAKSAWQESLKLAAKDLQDASAALGAAHAAGAAGERVNALKDSLAKLSEELSAASFDSLAKAPEAAPAAATSKAAAGSPTPEATVDPDLIRFLDQVMIAAKAGKMSDLIAMTKATDPAQQQAMDTIVAFMNSVDKLETACNSKFNSSFKQAAAGIPGMDRLLSMGRIKADDPLFTKESAKDLKIIMNDPNSATVADGADPTKLKKIDGRWWMVLDIPAAEVGQLSMILKGVGGALDETAADVTAGKFQAMPQVVQAFGMKLMATMQKVMGGKGGG